MIDSCQSFETLDEEHGQRTFNLVSHFRVVSLLVYGCYCGSAYSGHEVTLSATDF